MQAEGRVILAGIAGMLVLMAVARRQVLPAGFDSTVRKALRLLHQQDRHQKQDQLTEPHSINRLACAS